MFANQTLIRITVLADVQASFGHWLRKNSNRASLACFFEEHEMPSIRMIVPQSSALIEGYPQLPIPSNHRDMTKFSALDDIGYIRLVGQVRSMLLQHKGNQPKPHTEVQFNVSPRLLEEHESCMRDLSYPDMNGRFNGIRQPAEDTCGWLVGHPIYQQWTSSGDGIMWILGHPDTGKSTLMKYAVQESIHTRTVQREKPLTLSFFFYNMGSGNS